MIDWGHVIVVFTPHILIFGSIILLAQVINQIVADLGHDTSSSGSTLDLLKFENLMLVINALRDLTIQLFHNALDSAHGGKLLSPAAKTTLLILFIFVCIVRNNDPVYLLSFATFKAPADWKVSHEDIVEILKRQEIFTEYSVDFQARILARSGTGQATAWPPCITKCLKGKGIKYKSTIEESREEAKTVIFSIVAKALKRARVKASEIDVLVINCSLFSPTPSLCAMVVSEFGMRADIQSYNLSGMGCGASLISVDLAKNMLQKRSNNGGRALVVSTEIITPNLYLGNEKGFLLQNMLFRCGGSAMVLSNKLTDGRRAAYKLLNIVRVQGTKEADYQCVYEGEDENGLRGIRLSRDIVKVAGKCMEKNMTTMGPYVLPITEQGKVAAALIGRFFVKCLGSLFKTMGKDNWTMKLPVIKHYVPDFKTGIDHFCIHAGGRAVIDGIEKNMKLPPHLTEPSRMALLNYGNTSSSSIWYEMEYIQEYQKTNPLRKGHRIMQVAFGSGFKCTSGVWLKL